MRAGAVAPKAQVKILPLPGNKKIALIGPLADNSADMVGAWSGANNFGDVITLRAALEQHAHRNGSGLLYAKGTEISGNSEAGFGEAVKAARDADVAVLALGESSDMSGEAASRAHLKLPGNQQSLMEAIVAHGKAGRPACLFGSAAGARLGRVQGSRNHGSLVSKLTMSFPRAVGQEPLYYSQFPTGRPEQVPDPAHPGPVEKKYVSRYLDVANSALFYSATGPAIRRSRIRT